MSSDKHSPSDPAIFSTKTGVNRRSFLLSALMGGAAVAIPASTTGCGGSSTVVGDGTQIPTASAWSFGIIADSQWYQPDDGQSPFTVAVGILEQIQNQLINSGVKFVIQVGDLTSNASNSGSQSDIAGRALFAQPLYNAGIGFFPIRGNHEDSAASAANFQSSFPQTQNGVQNNSPSSVMSLTNPDAANGLVTPTNTLGKTFTQGSSFSSPDPWSNASLAGLSYAFDYGNARFVLLDQFTPINGWTSSATKDTSIAAQQSWVSNQLSERTAGTHGFVFSHKGLLTPYHKDVLCGESPVDNPTATNAFIESLATNKVHYLVCGHDHMHDRSLVTTTDGTSALVNQLVASSASCYNYYPRSTSISGDTLNDAYDYSAFGLYRRSAIAQELNTYGFYIVTVDGNNVTFDFYSGPSYATMDASQHQWDLATTPTVSFTHKESFGYSLIGQQFKIPYGSAFSAVKDTSPNGYVAQILSGKNLIQDEDYSGTQFVRVVNTGWATGSGRQHSDVLYLWGIHSTIGSEQSETYTLQISFNKTNLSSAAMLSGAFGIATRDNSGNWTKAVNANSGGSAKFVAGAWNSSYGLGSWGVDATNGLAWAVVNYAGAFVVTSNL